MSQNLFYVTFPSTFENKVNNETGLLLAILLLSSILNSGFTIEYFKCERMIPVDKDLL
jgi:hypothetical protein